MGLERDQESGAWSRWGPRRLASFAWGIWALLAYASAFPDEPRILLAVPCLFVGGFVSSVVHECGHAFAALACRWRVVTFVVVPIGFQIPNRNLAIVPRLFKPGYGGWVTSVPTTSAVDRGWRWSLVLASGPIASLLLGAAALAGRTGLHPLADGVDTRQLALGFGLQALYSGLFSLLPGGGKLRTDGDQLWGLTRTGGEYELNRAAKWLTTLLTSNVRLKDLPDWLLEKANVSAELLPDMARHLDTIAIGRALDSVPVDVARARQLIDEFRGRYGSDDWLSACDAYLAAIWEKDADRAKAALPTDPPPELRPLTLAAEAAVAARAGETQCARQRLDEMGIALKAESPFRNPTFDDIRRQIEALLDAPDNEAATAR